MTNTKFFTKDLQEEITIKIFCMKSLSLCIARTYKVILLVFNQRPTIKYSNMIIYLVSQYLMELVGHPCNVTIISGIG